MTHWKKLTNPLYLGAYSIEDGRDLILTISSVRQESVTGEDGKKEECTVCYFSDAPKPMILNSTNCKTITKLAGSPFIEKWPGLKVQIGIEKVKAFGDVVEALRVRRFPPKMTAEKCVNCGKDIIAAGGMSADQVAAYTLNKYGSLICAACAKKIAALKKADNIEQTEPNQQSNIVDSIDPNPAGEHK